MKWWQAAAKGVGDQYLSISDQEREHNSRMAQIREQGNIDQAKMDAIDAAALSTSFGEFTLKDRDEVPGDTWMTRGNKVRDFGRDFKSWFYDNGTPNIERYENFKQSDSQAFETMLGEYSGRLYQYMLPLESMKADGPGEETRTKYNTAEYDFMKPFKEFYEESLGIDKPRMLSNVTQVKQLKNGKNIVEMFDAVEGTDDNKLVELAGRDPDKVINSPQTETIKNIAEAMKPVLTHGMYGGEDMFTSPDEYDRKILGDDPDKPNGAFEHVAVIANVWWNWKNSTGGIENEQTRDEELAQLQIYYSLSNKQMLAAVNQMQSKFKIVSHSKGRKEIVRMKGQTNTELSSSGKAMEAQFRLNYLAKKLLGAIDEQNMTGAALNVQNLLHGLFGAEGQALKLYRVAGDYWGMRQEKPEFFDRLFKKGEHDMWDDAMDRLREYDKGDNWRKDRGSIVDYLTITLAYNLALSEQGSGGGKAISDKDFEQSLKRVRKLWGTTGQNRNLLKQLMEVNSRDLMISHIKTDNNMTATSRDMIKWWEGYGGNFDSVVRRYTDKLKDNPVYGGVLEPILDENMQPTFRIDDTGKKVMLMKVKTKLPDPNNPKKDIDFRYDGRLARLFTINFGDNPDLSAEPGVQGLWDSLGKHEKLVLRGDDANFDLYWSVFGQDSSLRAQTTTEILDAGQEEEIKDTQLFGDIAMYRNPEWWATAENPETIIQDHIDSIQGMNSEEGLWKTLAEQFPELKSEGYEAEGFAKVRNYAENNPTYQKLDPKVIEIFRKLDEMNRALRAGTKFKATKEKQKQEIKGT